MRTVTRRIGNLEDTFRPGNGKPLLLLVVTAAERRLALDQDRCVQILRECGFLLQHASNAAVGTLLRVMTDREAPAGRRASLPRFR